MRVAAALAATLAVTACAATPTPPVPRVDFTVHCKNGADLVSVKVTDGHGVDATPQSSDANNPHFGKFWYNPQVAGQKYGIEVGCGRNSYNPDDADYKTPKTLSKSDQTAWGTRRDFVCTPDSLRTGVCEAAPKDVAVMPSCSAGSLGAVATSVFVTPSVNQAGSATRVQAQGEIFKFTLNTPVTPYLVQVECQQGDQKWVARSVTPTIGAAGFDCTRPQLPYSQHGICTRPLPVG